MLSPSFAEKVDLLAKIDAYARAKDPKVVQVSANGIAGMGGTNSPGSDGQVLADVRPMVSIRVSVMLEKGGRGKAAAMAMAAVSYSTQKSPMKNGSTPCAKPCVMAEVNLEGCRSASW